MRGFPLIIRLASRDWWHERALSLCAVLALASMLAPLLVLYGVRAGLVETLRTNLLQDPTALIIIPSGSAGGGYSDGLFSQLRARPDVRFVIARTRDVAAEMQFVSKNGDFVPLTLEPTAQGDPLLERFKRPVPEDTLPGAEAVLSAGAARKLAAGAGDILQGRLGRKRPDGSLEMRVFNATVTGILPAEAIASDTAFCLLSVLEDIQDYRDYVAVPRRNFSGDPRPEGARRYESFRLYAKTLEDVEALDKFLHDKNIEVITKAKDIADIRKINQALTQLLLIIALAVGTGFVAFTMSSSLAAVRRKEKMLGMLRLLGFSRPALLSYPLQQVLLTSLFGTLAAWGTAQCVAVGVDAIFAQQLSGGTVCEVRAEHFVIALAAGIFLSLAAALYPALRAADIEPALVVRDL
ncbi:MAG: ABC transporter permease [Desulfovibrio sp.]|jgi:putative ABC transport system permease protein|nr:ABC transporter permease [Desulfovibrio sp.]